MNQNTSAAAETAAETTTETTAHRESGAATDYTLTVQPLTLDGLELDMPREHDDLDLFSALDLAHNEMRRARLEGATLTVEGAGSDYRWLVTYPDGEADRITITYRERCPKCEDIGGNPGCAVCTPGPDY